MAFLETIIQFMVIFRDIEKSIKKCVHMNGVIEHIILLLLFKKIGNARPGEGD